LIAIHALRRPVVSGSVLFPFVLFVFFVVTLMPLHQAFESVSCNAAAAGSGITAMISRAAALTVTSLRTQTTNRR